MLEAFLGGRVGYTGGSHEACAHRPQQKGHLFVTLSPDRSETSSRRGEKVKSERVVVDEGAISALQHQCRRRYCPGQTGFSDESIALLQMLQPACPVTKDRTHPAEHGHRRNSRHGGVRRTYSEKLVIPPTELDFIGEEEL